MVPRFKENVGFAVLVVVVVGCSLSSSAVADAAFASLPFLGTTSHPSSATTSRVVAANHGGYACRSVTTTSSSSSSSSKWHRGSRRITKLASSSDDINEPSSSSSSSSIAESKGGGVRRARDLMLSLVEESMCYSTEEGARQFAEVCAPDVVVVDTFYAAPFVGKTRVAKYMTDRLSERKGRGSIRIDKISDGDAACGFAWTWISDDGKQEGLRGTTYVALNENTGEIQYVQEMAEPIYKPGELTEELLRSVTEGAVPREPRECELRTPTSACDVAKYLYVDLQYADKKISSDELVRLLDDGIVYRDFNYADVMNTPQQVKEFAEKFLDIHGIEFRPVMFDDGVDSTCFTWEVVLDGAPNTIKGMSFYELDADSRKIKYVRDVPESAIKPPPLGALARKFRPDLGVFQSVPVGSRAGGM